MLNQKGFPCWITSEGRQLQTYVEESSGNVKSAWIASEPGKSFAVHWRDDSGKRIPTCGHVFVDGKDVASAIIRPGRSAPVKRAGVKVGKNAIKPFVFSELKLTDDDTLANQYDSSVCDVGSIKVQIKRVRLGAEVPFAGYEAKERGLVHERAKKAGAHCTKFGERKRAESSRTVGITTAPYDPNEPGPYVTFEFRYRSLDMLKALGIVQASRKRSNANFEADDVIEINSSEDEENSSSTMYSSPQRNSLNVPLPKRVKTEPQTDELPLQPGSSSPRNTDIDHQEATNDDTPLSSSTPSHPFHTPSSDRESISTLNNPTDQESELVKQEGVDDGEEDLDMLAGDDEGTFSGPSQDVDALPIVLPPPSSSPGPDSLFKEEEENE